MVKKNNLNPNYLNGILTFSISWDVRMDRWIVGQKINILMLQLHKYP